MTVPGGAGSESSQARQETNVADETQPGLPAATGASGGDPGSTADPASAGGEATDAVRDSGGEGEGSAQDPSGG
jgi:hypothetical protein